MQGKHFEEDVDEKPHEGAVEMLLGQPVSPLGDDGDDGDVDDAPRSSIKYGHSGHNGRDSERDDDYTKPVPL